MKKIIVVTFFLFSSLFIPQQVFAHFLATDKSIGAVLYVDPNDEPIAGSQASFFFEFKDKENKFDPQNCDCTFLIKENGNKIYSQPLFQNSDKASLSNAHVVYTFPQKDIYQVQVIGKPNPPNEFAPFTLSWDFRIDQEANPKSNQSNSNFNTNFLRYLLIFGVATVIIVAFFIKNLMSNKKEEQLKKGGGAKDEKK
ncbi:MAG: hypothetical protein ACR2LN_00040 [Candidatus Levyibacteriota bacterium]